MFDRTVLSHSLPASTYHRLRNVVINQRVVLRLKEMDCSRAKKSCYFVIHPVGIVLIRTSTSDMAPDCFDHCQLSMLEALNFDLAVLGSSSGR